MEADSELELESEESSDLAWRNTMEVEMEALLLFKMAEGHHVFHSKSRIKRLGMSYVIGLFSYLCIRFRSTSSHLIVSDGIRRKRKLSDPCDSDSVELKIKILSLFFLFTLEWKVPYTSNSVTSMNQP